MKKIFCLLLLSLTFTACGENNQPNETGKSLAVYSGRVEWNNNYTTRDFFLQLWSDNTYWESISIGATFAEYGEEYLVQASGKYVIEGNTISFSEEANTVVYMQIYEYGGIDEYRTTSELSKWFPTKFIMEGKQITNDIHPTGFKVIASKQ